MYAFSNIQVTEGDESEPLSLQDAKEWAEIDFDDKDGVLWSMLTGARRTIEGLTNLHLVAKTVTLDIETSKPETVILPYGSSFTNVVVKELSDKDEETTLTSATDYFLRGNTLRLTGCGRFTVSYKTAPVVPPDVLEAIKMEVAERFQNRGENALLRGNTDSPALGLSEAAKAKLQPYVQTWL